MGKTNFAVSFQLKKNKTGKDDKAPIYLRVTVDGKRFEMATGKSVEEKMWNNSTNRVKGKSETARIVNNYLLKLEDEVNEYRLKIDNGETPIKVDDFRKKFQGGKGNAYTLIHVFEENNKLVKQGLGHKYSESTFNQYKTTLARLKVFLDKEYNISDIELSQLDVGFIARFDSFLRLNYKIGDNTVAKYLKQLKKVIHYSMTLRYLRFDPFDGYKISYSEVDRGFLSEEELKNIENKVFRIKRLGEVRDVFIFVCYTGLSYGDLNTLSYENIIKGIDGKNWIKFERKKTGVISSIPILKQAQTILDKYSRDPECLAYNRLLPIKSNQKLNSYLAEIAELCEIDKHITMHLGRHTFATTVTLTNGVSIESVKQMLGHKNLSTTQIYSRITDTKVSNDMNMLEEKLSDSRNKKNDDKMKKII